MHPGERIREERERLGLSQTEFAELAGATRKTLFNWESGVASPNITVVAAWAERGLDVLYVVTGQRAGGVKPGPGLTAEEQTLLGYFREASKEVRRAALGALIGAPAAPAKAAAPRDINMVSTKNNGVQFGYVAGTVSGVKKK